MMGNRLLTKVSPSSTQQPSILTDEVMNHKQHHNPRASVHRQQRGEVQDSAQEGVQADPRRDLPEGQGNQVSMQYNTERMFQQD